MEPCRLAEQLGLVAGIGIEVMPIDSSVDLSPLAARLPPALRGAVARRQREFLFGRCCAARALARAGHAGDGWLPLGDDRLPVWPDGWVGSISHSRFGAMAATAHASVCRALGVDMEPLIHAPLAAEIEAAVAGPDELALLAPLPREWRATVLFSAKESLFKALYPQVRKFHDFGAAHVCALEDNGLRMRLGKRWGAGLPEGFEMTVRYAVRDGHVYSVASLS